MKIIATFSYRYDKELVPGLLKNISWVDDVVSIDDTENKDLWFDERKMRIKLNKIAIAKGADWILETDPDERWEKNAGDVLRALAKHKSKIVFEIKFRELYTPIMYRIDGIWGRKRRRVLYPVYPGQINKDREIHYSGFPINKEYKVIPLDLNLYHLKMIEPKNRKLRAEIFKKLDPSKKYQAVGYDYLIDETNMKLEKIPVGRAYLPKYKKWEFRA
jgi:hypothetical protein